jgi:hypothetical protein
MSSLVAAIKLLLCRLGNSGDQVAIAIAKYDGHFVSGRSREGDRVVRISADCESDLATEKGGGPYLRHRLLLAIAGFASVASRRVSSHLISFSSIPFIHSF